MIREEIINSFDLLGKKFRDISSDDLVIKRALDENQWFIPEFSLKTIKYWAEKLTKDELNIFTKNNKFNKTPQTIGLVTAGNIPLVGFHDLMCIMLSGNNCKIKISSLDSVLMRYAIDVLIEINSGYKNKISIAERLNECEAFIATGSNNTSRYFEYYFKGKPSIIRKNRNSIAILTGDETDLELQKLGDDIFTYFGLGCRNVSKIFVPINYSFDNFFKNLESFRFVENHNKYFNNYTYHKAIFLMNNSSHLDNGFLILKEDSRIHSPLSCLFYTYYKNLKEVEDYINNNSDEIQIVLSQSDINIPQIKFGNSQNPELYSFADNIDTMSFLSNTIKNY